MKKIKRLLTLALCGALCVGIAGCGKNQTVVSAGDYKASAAVYVLNQMNALSEATSQDGYDSSLEDVWDNEIDGQSMEDWINNRALELCREYVAVNKLFEEKGLSLTEDEQTAIDESMESFSYYEELYTAIGVSESTYEEYLVFNSRYQELFLNRYQEGGDAEVSEEELRSFYCDNFDEVKLIALSYTESSDTDEDEEDEEEDDTSLEAVQATAQGYLDRLQAGEDMDDLIYEYQQSVASDSSTVTKNESVDNITVISANGENSTSYTDDVLEQMVAIAQGDSALVQDTENCYIYIVYKVDQDSNTEYYDENRDNVLYEMKSDEFEEFLVDYANNEMGATVNSLIQSRYSCKKVYEEQNDFITSLYSQYYSY